MSTSLQSLLVLGKFSYATFSAGNVTVFGLLFSVTTPSISIDGYKTHSQKLIQKGPL